MLLGRPHSTKNNERRRMDRGSYLTTKWRIYDSAVTTKKTTRTATKVMSTKQMKVKKEKEASICSREKVATTTTLRSRSREAVSMVFRLRRKKSRSRRMNTIETFTTLRQGQDSSMKGKRTRIAVTIR